MKTNLNAYRTYSSGKLELIRNTLEKDYSKIEKKIEELEDKKTNVEDKILRINNIVEQNIEKKIGKKPFDRNRDFKDNLFLFFGYVFSCYIAYNIEGFDSIIAALVFGFVVFIFVMPLMMFGFGIIEVVIDKILGISIEQKKKKYDKEYNNAINSEKRKQFKGKEKNLNFQIKQIEQKINKHNKEIDFLEILKRELPGILRRARQREKTAKIAAYDRKTRDASETVRKDLIRAVKNKNNWKCPYCNTKKSFATHQTDHIHPVSKGGLAIPENMIPICKECNQNKKALTLRVFCKKFGFNFNEVCERLELQGKDV